MGGGKRPERIEVVRKTQKLEVGYLMNQTLGEGFRRRGGVVLRTASFF
jgi:hypothetical protein